MEKISWLTTVRDPGVLFDGVNADIPPDLGQIRAYNIEDFESNKGTSRRTANNWETGML